MERNVAEKLFNQKVLGTSKDEKESKSNKNVVTKKVVNFRTNATNWDLFINKCHYEGEDASKILSKFIATYVQDWEMKSSDYSDSTKLKKREQRKERLLAIRNWKKENPDGTQADCCFDLEIPKKIVIELRNE